MPFVSYGDLTVTLRRGLMPLACVALVGVGLLANAAMATAPTSASAEVPVDAEQFETWPVLQPSFPSTGGGGITIGEYRPVVTGSLCATFFSATEPNGTVHRNHVVFDAVPAQGGILCENGRWSSADGSASGTTPLRIFVKDGVTRGLP